MDNDTRHMRLRYEDNIVYLELEVMDEELRQDFENTLNAEDFEDMNIYISIGFGGVMLGYATEIGVVEDEADEFLNGEDLSPEVEILDVEIKGRRNGNGA